MKVEPSGVIMLGICQVKTPLCTARSPHAITAVHDSLTAGQIDVCKPCLDEMIRRGEWEIAGAKVPGMRPRFDIALVRPGGGAVLVVEAKLTKDSSTNQVESLFRSGLEKCRRAAIPNFLLAFPNALYLQEEGASGSALPTPLDPSQVFNRTANSLGLVPLHESWNSGQGVPSSRSAALVEASFLLLLHKWLRSELRKPNLLPRSLINSLKGCKVHLEYSPTQ